MAHQAKASLFPLVSGAATNLSKSLIDNKKNLYIYKKIEVVALFTNYDFKIINKIQLILALSDTYTFVKVIFVARFQYLEKLIPATIVIVASMNSNK